METGLEQSEGVVPFGERPGALEERLERGEVVSFATCPFPLPAGADGLLLLQQSPTAQAKDVSWDPITGQAEGLPANDAPRAGRLRGVLAACGEAAATWVAAALPRYAGHCRPEHVNFHPEEEATRCVRLSARNDLLHVDAFTHRPTHGRRILRLFVNLNPTDPRVWVTSDTFATLLERYGREVGLPGAAEDSWAWHLGRKVLGLLQTSPTPAGYDRFMLRFQHYLKANEEFQERCRKRFLTFPPGSAWLAFTDAVSHAVLRGRFALDHTFFVAPEALVLPDLSPPVLLQRAGRTPIRRRAA